ncbi:lamina-associated polypeptide 2, isoforms alpha/zeta-like [Ranitomeya imitator]|uniref:lamina-associated polypeptide 2, isoforms alpha/zeta-like n=1 Tax=Ranitomeya imitator TaxID=111125 RepID=UPI0037E87C01
MESPEGTTSQQQQEPQQLSDKPRRSSQRRSSGSSRAGGAKEARISIPKSSARKDLPASKDPPSTGRKSLSKAKHRQCAECAEPLPDGHLRKLCKICIQRLLEEEAPDLTSTIREMVRQEIKGAERSKSRGAEAKRSSPLSEVDSDSGELSSGSLPSTSSSEDQESARACLSLERVNHLVKAVNSTMGIEDTQSECSIQDVMFRGIERKSRRAFPVIDKIKSLISKEWKKPERKGSLPPAFKRRYPFEEAASSSWDKVPKLDAAVAKACKKSSLPFDDLGNLKDPLDRKADIFLKGAWETSAGSLRPAIAATCTARSLMVWLGHLEDQLRDKVPRSEILSSMSTIQDAAAFLSDASADSVRLAARSSALSNAARRALWIKCWPGDLQARTKLCSIPCEGAHLFGPVLDELLEKAGDSKKTLSLPRKTLLQTGL